MSQQASESPPVTAPDLFVGRWAELELLSASLGRARAGHGALVGLAGESGVGKTSLARAFAARSAESGTPVIWGGCFEGDWRPAYGPWVEALRSGPVLPHALALGRQLGWAAPVLAKLLPELADLSLEAPHLPPLGPEEEQLRLFEAVVQLLKVVSGQAATLLVIEDLHWADRDSLQLLRYVSRLVGRLPLLIVATFRSEDLALEPLHPLGELIHVLRRETGYLQIDLQGLAPGDMAEYLAAISGGPVPDELSQEIYRETDGNPFYAGEIYRHLAQDGPTPREQGDWRPSREMAGRELPAGVRSLLRRRVARLAAGTQEVLQLAAGFTRGFTCEELGELTGLPASVLWDGIDEATRAGLLAAGAGTPATYAFAHAIVRHALLEDLNPDRRAHLHRRIALALEKTHAGREDEHAGELASQFHLSASIPGAERGLRYALGAADQATATSSRQRAARFLRIAVDLATAITAADRAAIVCRLAIAEAEAVLLHDAAASARAALEALAAARAGPAEQADFLYRIARALKEGGAEPGLWAPLVEQGLALVGGEHLLAWARLVLLRDRFEPVAIDGINVALWMGHDTQAVAIARQWGDEDDYALTLEPLDLRSREETYALLALVRRWHKPAAILRALDVAGRDLLKRQGALREAAQLYEEMLAVGERCGSIAGRAEALLQKAIIQFAMGDFALAQQTARDAQDMITRLGSAHELRFGTVALKAMFMHFLDGDWRQAAGEAARFASSPAAARNPRSLVAGAYAALGYARVGDEAEALRLVTALTPVLRRVRPEVYVHHAAVAFGGSAVWECKADRLAADYRRMALELLGAGFGDSILVHELTVARMASLLGRRREAHRYFELARAKCDAGGLRPVRAIIDYDEALSRFRLGVSARSAIEPLLASAIAAFEALGMMGWRERARALRAEVDRGEGEEMPGKRLLPAGLTPREAEVLGLIARGRTNAEIAVHLHLSVRTIDRHVENAYRKLGVRGRVEATAFALRQGLI